MKDEHDPTTIRGVGDIFALLLFAGGFLWIVLVIAVAVLAMILWVVP
jgi:hypothetical protein